MEVVRLTKIKERFVGDTQSLCNGKGIIIPEPKPVGFSSPAVFGSV